jgi:hypothetical protein
MKKPVFLAFLLGLFTMGIAQPRINGLTFPQRVNLFDLYEISFQLGTYANPYDPAVIDVYAEFTYPDGRVSRVNGFYYEGYRLEEHHTYEKAYAETKNNGWKVRFTPDQVGIWQFSLHAIDKKGTTNLSSYNSTPFSFTCNNVRSATGFITKANTQYLKRETVANGKRQNRSFFPVGPNVAWYTCKSYYNFATPYGTYEYKRRIDSLAGRANYMRVWLNRPQYLSLYGPEYTQMVDGKPTIYFDKTLNQKDAAELDFIVNYAAQNDISLMLCFFTYGDFMQNHKHDNELDKYPDDWRNNPFHTILGLKSTEDFFTDKDAKRITKNLIRYIVARWGYATNIMTWELWNEVTNMDFDKDAVDRYRNIVIDWHDEMASYIHANDPFGHLVSSSMGSTDPEKYLFHHCFNSLDFVQHHNYFNVQKAKSKEQPSYQMYLRSIEAHDFYPQKPFFIGEFGFGKLNSTDYLEKDPYGIELHNSLWSTLFSGSMGAASFWQWTALDKCGNHGMFKPVLIFCKDLPILSATFTPHTTGEISKTNKHTLVFPNNLETYYIVNGAQDTLYGWSQDTAFAYQSLRRLTDKTGTDLHFKDGSIIDSKGYVYTLNPDKKPRPSSKSNTITLPIDKQANGTRYTVRWFDTETGKEIVSESTTAVVRNQALTIEFPSSIRNLRRRRINNTFGDAVFVITRENENGSTPESNAANKTKKIRVKKGTNGQ